MRRRTLIGSALGALGSAAWWKPRPFPPEVGFTLGKEELAAALALMRESPMHDDMGPVRGALNSDMDASYRPAAKTYRKMPLVIGALLRRGHDPDGVRQLAGGNFLRVWRQPLAAA